MRFKFRNFRFLLAQKGQGVMEYMIITSLIGIVCIAAVKNIGKSIETRLDHAKKQINRTISLQ